MSCGTSEVMNNQDLQLNFEKKLSIVEPLFDDDREYDYLFHFSRGAPYFPYQFLLKPQDGWVSTYRVGFQYDYKNKSKSIILQIPSLKKITHFNSAILKEKK